MLNSITSLIKRYIPTHLERFIPGMYEINRDDLQTGYLWLIGTLIGYLASIVPGLIIHGIYIWLHKDKKNSPVLSKEQQQENAENVKALVTEGQATLQKNLTEGQAALQKNLKEHQERAKAKKREKEERVEALIKNRSIVFKQKVTYKGGIKGRPQASKKQGILYVFEDSIGFQDKDITWELPYSQTINVDLDKFEIGSIRGVAAKEQAQSFQEVRNNLIINYLDDEEVERTARFHVHGAKTIYGEGQKASELLNYIFEFKGQFHKA